MDACRRRGGMRLRERDRCSAGAREGDARRGSGARGAAHPAQRMVGNTGTVPGGNPVTFIVIPRFDAEGCSLDSDIYPLDTDEQVSEARAAMREACLETAPVWTGEPDEGESLKTCMIFFAEVSL
jgi:hypothetical protein